MNFFFVQNGKLCEENFVLIPYKYLFHYKTFNIFVS
jgi:hypothetical protein